MDIYKLKFTLLQQEIFRFLCANTGKSFTGRNISKHLNVSPTAISKSLPLLKKEDLIVSEKDEESGRLAIELNSENPKVVYMKRIENLRLIYDSRLAEFLSDKFPISIITLVNDFATGTDKSNSEIEIAIGTTKKNISLEKFENILGKKIVLTFYNSKNPGTKIKELLSKGTFIAGGNK